MIDDITIFNLSLSFIFFFFDGNDLNELYASAHECVQSIFFPLSLYDCKNNILLFLGFVG
jgi:hypothetical protein